MFRLIKIKEWIDKNDPGAMLIPFSGALEFKLVDMPEDERPAYLKEVGTTRYVRVRPVVIYFFTPKNLIEWLDINKI